MLWSPDLIHWYGDEAIRNVEHPDDKPRSSGAAVMRGCILDPSGEKGGDQTDWGTVCIRKRHSPCSRSR